ncbi:hypothetical protein B0H14DRAFT_1505387 [Mycena olivaceomarginata]|nr:hypothetical protein B0H14DRAFT_1505387 [Mycena olivaceomarginata]
MIRASLTLWAGKAIRSTVYDIAPRTVHKTHRCPVGTDGDASHARIGSGVEGMHSRLPHFSPRLVRIPLSFLSPSLKRPPFCLSRQFLSGWMKPQESASSTTGNDQDDREHYPNDQGPGVSEMSQLPDEQSTLHTQQLPVERLDLDRRVGRANRYSKILS